MSNSRRLFFALSLPDALQQQVIRWRAEAFAPEAGRPVAAANLHLTLAFLGEVTAQKELALRKLAGRIVQPGFSMRLDDLGHWPRPGVVWLGTRRAPRGLLQLAELLRSQAARSGCRVRVGLGLMDIDSGLFSLYLSRRLQRQRSRAPARSIFTSPSLPAFLFTLNVFLA